MKPIRFRESKYIGDTADNDVHFDVDNWVMIEVRRSTELIDELLHGALAEQ